MSTKPPARDKGLGLPYGVAALLLVILIFLGVVAGGLNQRRSELHELALDQVQQMLRVRMDGLFQEIADVLALEAQAIGGSTPGTVILPTERWMALMRAKPAVMAIHLADENGNSRSLVRDTAGYHWILRGMTLPEPDQDVSLQGKQSHGGDERTPVRSGDRDLRTTAWFNKALGSTRTEPIWNLSQWTGDQRPVLQVSQLVRSRYAEAPYHVIAFELDPARSRWVDLRSSPLTEYGAMLIDDAGTLLNLPDAGKDAHLQEAESTTAQRWAHHRSRKVFAIEIGDRGFLALVNPYILHGQTLYSGTLVDKDLLVPWLAPETRALWIMVGLMALLVLLLAMMWLRKRREEEFQRRQEKRSRSQEQQLAKALGEREVLNREVHHRVKNNLQVVSSLLNLQASRLADDEVRAEFLRGKQRIDTIALVHHKLYALGDLRQVDLKRFMDGLMESLAERQGPQRRSVSHDVRTSNIRVDQDTAIELGIILCELVSNAYDHAFPYATGGHVDVTVQHVEGTLYRMQVKDNGKGITNTEHNDPTKLGLEIVEALSEQLDGSFHLHVNGGTTCDLLFRMRQGSRLAEGVST